MTVTTNDNYDAKLTAKYGRPVYIIEFDGIETVFSDFPVVTSYLPDDVYLVCHYKLDEEAGTDVSDETENYDGVYTNPPGGDAQWITGVDGNAADFVSADSAHIRTNEEFESTFQAPFSINLRLKLDDGITGADQYICGFSCKRYGTNHSWVYITVSSTGQINAWYRCGSSNLTTISIGGAVESYFPNGQTGWKHIVVVVDEETEPGESYSGRIKLYIDSVLQGTDISDKNMDMSTYGVYDKNAGGFILSGANLYGESVPYRPIDGAIDDFRIYNIALTQNQVTALYNLYA